MLKLSRLLIIIVTILPFIASSQTGPGGIGTTDASSSLKMWYRVDNGVTGPTNVSAWTNSAGETNHNLTATGSQQPTLANGSVNGYDELSFDGNDFLEITGSLTTSNFVNDEATTFVVSDVNTTSSSWVYATSPHQTNRFSCHITWSNGTVYYDIGNCCGTTSRLQVGSLTGVTNYSYWSYDALGSTGKQLYRNGTLLQDLASSSTYNSHASHTFRIGESFNGNLTEVIIFNQKVNEAQRIIVENYLSAKYNITAGSNDIYTMDDGANGDYDHDVAGIGRVDASNEHTDSRGTGIVQVTKTGGGLGNNEFLLWGHDNGLLGTFGGNDTPAGVDARMIRTWRVSEQGEPGSVLISFDLTGLGPVTTSELRLLIDSDADGDFSNATVISGAVSLGSNVYQFDTQTNNALEDGDTFTIGTTDANSTPLPIELISFDAYADKRKVQLHWTTASELNNDYFTIERSADVETWEIIKKIKGAGNSTSQMNYSDTDDNPNFGTSYYRLKQTDFNGAYSYSNIVSVHIEPILGIQNLKISPNPSNGYVNISFTSSAEDEAELSIYDQLGKLIHREIQTVNRGLNSLERNFNQLTKGHYILTIKTSIEPPKKLSFIIE